MRHGIGAVALATLATLAAPAWAFHPDCHDLSPTPRDVVLADGLAATVDKTGELVRVVGPDGAGFEVEAIVPRTPAFEGDLCLHDIDGDDTLDLMIPTGIGYGGVNVFFTFAFWRDGDWLRVDGISNPDFTSARDGFIASARSGPAWTTGYWAFGPDGVPRRVLEQTATFAGADLRRVLAPDGHTLETLVVPAGLPVTEPARPALATVTGGGGLPIGTRVRIVAVDTTEGMLTVETEDGTHYRLAPDDILPDA